MGTFHNADYVASMLPSVKRFRAPPQGGWFFPQVGQTQARHVTLGRQGKFAGPCHFCVCVCVCVL